MSDHRLNNLNEHRAFLAADLGHGTTRPPAQAEDILAAEKVMRLRLPTSLKSLLLEVGNGGFGPGYGLMGVALRGAGPGVSLEETCLAHTGWCAECGFDWPATLVPVVDPRRGLQHVPCGPYFVSLSCQACSSPLTASPRWS